MTKKKPAVQFASPPPPRGREGYEWGAIAEALRAKPGEWALIFEQDRRSMANAARQGSITVFDTGEFEFRTRNNRIRESDGRPVCDLYARFIG